MKSAGRLLFVVTRGRIDPAGIKRVYDLLPFFRALGYETCVASYDWEWLWKMRLKADLGSRSHRRLLYALNAARAMPAMIRFRYARTLDRLARSVKSADAVIVLRGPMDQEWRDILKSGARRVIYDFDDAVWLNDEIGFAEMMKLADEVVAGNWFLAERASRVHSRVSVIPTGVRLDRYEKTARRATGSDGCLIGWVGSPSTVSYLETLVSPLAALGNQLDLRLRIVGAGASPLPRFRNVKIESFPAIPYDPVDFVPHFDIGVMPMADTEWERGKCGAKLLEYMAAGVPAVSSAVGENLRIIEDGATGLFARDEEEWVEALRLLAFDADRRRRIGEAARGRIREKYSSRVVASMWGELLAGSRQIAAR